jgi:hypothetical protein
MRIGIDLGGTKIEAIALDHNGHELHRRRVPTPQGDYAATLAAIQGLVETMETLTGQTGTVGVGIPGTIVRSTGLVKNANSTWLNGQPLELDLSAALGREVRCANDANCFAVSEATDGAAKAYDLVFGVILGTGCGGGISIGHRVHAGRNGLGGEWGHLPLPWPTPAELPGPAASKPGSQVPASSATSSPSPASPSAATRSSPPPTKATQSLSPRSTASSTASPAPSPSSSTSSTRTPSSSAVVSPISTAFTTAR